MARRDARLLLAAALAALLAGSGALGQLQVDFGQVRAAPPPPPPPPPPPRPRRTAALAQPGGRGANSGPPRGKGGRIEGKARPQGPDVSRGAPAAANPAPGDPRGGPFSPYPPRTPPSLEGEWGRASPARCGGRAGGMPGSLLPGVPREESWGLLPAPAAPAAPDRPDRPLQ